MEPRAGAGMSDRTPPNDPIGVLARETMTTSESDPDITTIQIIECAKTNLTNLC